MFSYLWDNSGYLLTRGTYPRGLVFRCQDTPDPDNSLKPIIWLPDLSCLMLGYLLKSRDIDRENHYRVPGSTPRICWLRMDSQHYSLDNRSSWDDPARPTDSSSRVSQNSQIKVVVNHKQYSLHVCSSPSLYKSSLICGNSGTSQNIFDIDDPKTKGASQKSC